jgi:hypothetical protein
VGAVQRLLGPRAGGRQVLPVERPNRQAALVRHHHRYQQINQQHVSYFSQRFYTSKSEMHPVLRITGCLSRIRIKEFKYFNPKKWFLSSRKYDPGCSSRILIFYPSRSGSCFCTLPGSMGQKSTGSRIRIRNTGCNIGKSR